MIQEPTTDRAGDQAAEGAERAQAAARVGRNTGLLMIGDLLDRALGFAFLLVGTKIYGLEIYGAYLIALGVFQVVRAFVSFGLGRSLVKDAAAAVAVEDLGRLKGTILLGFLISLPLAIACGTVLMFGARELVAVLLPTQSRVTEPLRIFGLLTPLFSFNFVLLQALYGMGRIRDMVLANNIIEPLTRLAALLVLFASGVSGYYALPGAYAIALVVSSLFGVVIFAKSVLPTLAGVRPVLRVRETLAFVIPITLNDLATRSFRTFNIAIFAVYRTAFDVSIFSVALKLTGVAFLFSSALMGAFRPRISALLAQGRNDVLSAEARVYTRWILTFSLYFYGLMIAFPADMLGLLGPQFVPAASTLRILCVGLLIGQSAGPLMALLMMSGRSRQSVYFIAAGATCYTALAMQMIPWRGTEGAALSAVATIFVFAPVVSTYVQRTLQIRLYDRRMLKPLGAIATALALGFAVSLAVPAVSAEDGHHLLRIARAGAIGTVVGVAYLAILVRLGIEAEERELLGHAGGRFAKIARKIKILRG